MVKIKIKKLNEKAKLPKFAYPTDAGADLVPVSVTYDKEHDYFCYGLGFAMAIPEGYCAKIYPRSSNRKVNAYMTNHVGIVDAHYRGEVMVTFKERDNEHVGGIIATHPEETEKYAPFKLNGKAIAQMVIEKLVPTEYEEVDELDATDRGVGGHGSTDNHKII